MCDKIYVLLLHRSNSEVEDLTLRPNSEDKPQQMYSMVKNFGKSATVKHWRKNFGGLMLKKLL